MGSAQPQAPRAGAPLRATFRPVRFARASDAVVRQVKALIFDGQLAPGDQLAPEKALARQFRLSRATVRDALRVLESQGLVEIRVGARGGVFVARPSTRPVSEALTNLLRLRRTTVAQLVEARLLVEPEVAALAARRATAADLRAMAGAIARARAGLAARQADFIPHSVAFHLALAEAAKNPVLLSTVNSFRALFHEAVARLLPDDEMAERAVVDHQEILTAVAARDSERARRLMHEHLRYFARRVRTMRARRGRPTRWRTRPPH
ncbi:MAG: FCD domain-containing protein [Armatimonadota bacterium]|nr:FCD domain-containing protein [Armatimonadota bacterium]MDR7533767.1 FCD domain-containing protein [Armatimonadota bacterium]MDR7535757.1 FCD domain-containing protein [Armatimonadota bacterium]